MITREQVRSFLGDGEWKTGLDIIDHFYGTIPPEQAAQAYYKDDRSPRNKDAPEEAAVRLGVQYLVSKMVSGIVRNGDIESYGSGRLVAAKKFRWVSWYCHLCGERMIHSERPEDCLCGVCKDNMTQEK